MNTKEKTQYVCSACAGTTIRWLGKCPHCDEWNTLIEASVVAAKTKNRFASLAGTSAVTPIGKIESNDIERTPIGIPELDRVLGGGVVEGAVWLFAGAPGVGKSTLLLQALDMLERQGIKTLYVSGEESLSQLRLRANRIGVHSQTMLFQAEVQLEKIIATIESEAPKVVVIDSLQTLWTEALSAAPGNTSQLKECTAHLTRLAKARNTTIFAVGHINKENDISGPMTLSHIVDGTFMFEGESNSNYKIIRCQKNRFGPTQEIGVFAMVESGLRSVQNPSAIFLSNHSRAVPGSCVMATVDGTRPMLVEIQALVDPSSVNPRRLTVGLERDRLSMLLAVLNRHGEVHTNDSDIYLNAVGGLRISEPAADLAVLASIFSSLQNKALPQGLVVFGEIGLTGEVRPAPKGAERLHESYKLGFTNVILPKANAPKKPISGMTIHTVERVEQLLATVRSLS